MSIDEKLRRIVQAHLLPGETLAWAGPAVTPGRGPLALLVAAATFLGVVILGTGGTMFASSFFSFPVIFGVFVGALAGALVLVMAVVSDRANNKPTHYAITDRRILFLSTLTGETIPVAAYGPQDIQFVRRRDRRDGTSDLFLCHADGPTRGTMKINGIAVPYQGPTPDIALRGVADAGAVEALIVALQAGQLAGTVPVPPEPPSGPSSGPSSEMAGEREIILSKFTTPWMAGVMCLLVGLPFLGIGIAVGLGRFVMYSGEGASATPASPLDGLLVFGGVGLACSLLGGGLLLWRDVLTADPAARTYQIRRGFVPFAKPIAGTFADFQGIRLTREDAVGPYRFLWHVRLDWKEVGRKPYVLLMTPYAPHGAGKAARMAAMLGLPLDDRGAEVTPTEQKA